MTTAFGLAVAIPTMLIAHHFEGRIERMEGGLQYLLSVLNEIVATGIPGMDRIEPVAIQTESPAGVGAGASSL